MIPLNLKGQIIKGIYSRSHHANWVLLKTNRATYELRLGGLEATVAQTADDFALGLDVIDQQIRAVKTDEFALYFELENGECLVHSDNWIDKDGNMSFALKLLGKSQFDREKEEWYDSDPDLKEIE